MRRLNRLGIYVLVLLGVSCAVAASAFAEPPEYYVCAKAPKDGKTVTGEYRNSSCSEASAEDNGKYELESWEHAKKKAFKTKTGQTTLDAYEPGFGIVASTVCEKDTGTGEVTGPKTTSEVITFQKCTDGGKPCTSQNKAKKGEIVTYPLDGELGTISEGPPLRVGVRYTGTGPEETFASFDCEGLELDLRGSVIGEVTGNIETPSKTSDVVFAVNEVGEQAITRFQGGPQEPLVSSIEGVGSYSSGWANPDYVQSEPFILEPPCLAQGRIAPSITREPVDETVEWPAGAKFSAGTSCQPLAVEWQESNYARIPGATSMVYTIPRTTVADNGKQYRACFTFDYFASCTQWATLTVNVPPCRQNVRVTEQPVSVTVTEKEQASFGAKGGDVSENCLVTQWWEAKASAPLSGWSAIPGATSGEYAIEHTKHGETGTQYRDCFTDETAVVACTNGATLTVLESAEVKSKRQALAAKISEVDALTSELASEQAALSNAQAVENRERNYEESMEIDLSNAEAALDSLISGGDAEPWEVADAEDVVKYDKKLVQEAENDVRVATHTVEELTTKVKAIEATLATRRNEIATLEREITERESEP